MPKALEQKLLKQIRKMMGMIGKKKNRYVYGTMAKLKKQGVLK